MGRHRAEFIRPKDFHWSRKIIAAVSSLTLIATAIGGGVMFAINGLGKNIKIIDTSDLNNANRPLGVVETDSSPINILIMGSDSRVGEGNTGYGIAEGQRSDTTLLVHIYEGRKSAIIVSIPRDSYVTIPDCKDSNGNLVKSKTQKFNAAFGIGGPVCTIKTIESLTNVRVDKFVVIDFNAFKKIVDVIGGVEICLVNPVKDPIVPGVGGTNLDLPAGYSTLNGDQALQFVRARENLGDGSDLSRIERQQAFMGAMVRDMTKKDVLSSPSLIFQILQAITESMATSSDWASLNTLQEFALSMADLRPNQIKMVTTPNQIIENGNVSWTSEANDLWKAIANNQRWPPPEPQVTPTPTVEALPSPGEVTLLVLNGTSTSGKARTTANYLAELGFVIFDFGSSKTRTDTTEIRFSAENELAAKALAKYLGFGNLVVDENSSTEVTLVIGKDWDTLFALSESSPKPSDTSTPSPEPTLTITTDPVLASDSGCINAS